MAWPRMSSEISQMIYLKRELERDGEREREGESERERELNKIS